MQGKYVSNTYDALPLGLKVYKRSEKELIMCVCVCICAHICACVLVYFCINTPHLSHMYKVYIHINKLKIINLFTKYAALFRE